MIIVSLQHLIASIDSVHPDPDNARTNHDLQSIADSLTEYGQRTPIVANKDGTIEKGNGTWQAAKMLLGWSEIAISFVDDDQQTAKGYALADNITGDKSKFDTEKLMAALGSFADPLEVPGIDEEWLQGLELDIVPEDVEAGDTEAQVDRAEELQAEWGVEVGQVWELGPHRIVCGDCTDREVVERLMGGEKSEIVFTSPPYLDMRDYGGTADLSIEKLTGIFTTFVGLVNYFVVNLGLKFSNHEVVSYWDEWISAARDTGLKLLSWNVWDKINAGSVNAQSRMFALQHEWIFVFGDSPKKLERTWEKSIDSAKREASFRVNNRGQKVTSRRQVDGTVRDSAIGQAYDNKQLGSVITCYSEQSRSITSHPAMFPVQLPEIYIETMTNQGDIVIDPFLGAGTTLIAAHNLNRICRGIELEPKYVAVCLQRFQDHTGIKPILVEQQ